VCVLEYEKGKRHVMKLSLNAVKGTIVIATMLTTLGITASQASAQTDSISTTSFSVTKQYGAPNTPYAGT
jgi:hypothetical protein